MLHRLSGIWHRRKHVIWYVLISEVYIVLSSELLNLQGLPSSLQAHIETLKGLLFVIVSGLLAERLLLSRAAKLEAMRSALKERLASTVARGVSPAAVGAVGHEMKNVLMGTLSAFELLADSEPNLDCAERRELETGLRFSLDRLTRLSSELMSMVRRDLDESSDLFDLSQMAQATAGSLLIESGASRTVVDVDAPVPCWVKASPHQVEHAVLNLLTNAVQATGVTGKVRLSVRRRDGLVSVRITDDGPGLAPDIRERLFEPFVTSKVNGNGLGLVLSRQVARLFGGDLRVLTSSKAGTTFELTLPLVETAHGGQAIHEPQRSLPERRVESA